MVFLRRALAQFSLVALATKFVLDGSGRTAGIGRWAKLKLCVRLFRNSGKVPSLTSLQQQFVLVRDIVGVPSSVPGDVVECGCYAGGSTIALSLACALAGRKLFVCDSFAGLPTPRVDEAVDVHPLHQTYYQWQAGDFSSPKGLEGVRENVRSHGNLEACVFVAGFYADTLPGLAADKIILVYEDADLASSVADCLKYLWPRLQPGCKFYCQEPWSIPVIALFYDERWWKENLAAAPPGFFGSGGGVDYALSSSGMGFAIKFDPLQIRTQGRRILHEGLKSYVPR
jgi:O-methyltransferase